MTADDEARPVEKRRQVWVARARSRGEREVERANRWVAERQSRQEVLDLAVALRDRDRDAFASVLGSALALRLFLFTMAMSVTIVSLLNLLFGSSGVHESLGASGVTGQLASEVEGATNASAGRDLGLLLTGLFLGMWAGRTLTKVLAACSVGAWRMEGRAAKATVQIAVRVTGLVALLLVAASLLNRLRVSYGVAVATGSLAINVAVLGVGWFFVCLSLPKPTRDPGAMLPGAVLFGVLMTVLQWFMQFYLPHRIAGASETMGAMGLAVAALGYLFLIGRIMAGTIVVNAVLWERFGSISAWAFSLPGVRRLPARYPKVARFFDLERGDDPAGARAALHGEHAKTR